MARIVCQVLHRAERITFLWSEGAASFEPYHLEGAERAHLLDIAGQIHGPLARGDGAALAKLGQQLHRAVFRQDGADAGSASSIRSWLAGLATSNSIEKLEFLSDVPGLIPFNLLIDDVAGGDVWPRFWGARFNLAAGRRVNPLRENPTQTEPTQLFAADLDLLQQLAADQQALLAPLREANRLVHTSSALDDELKRGIPDIVLLLVRFEAGKLRLGADAFGLAELQTWLEEPKEGNPDPLIIVMGCGAASEQTAWQAFLNAATASFSGLVANETLLPAPQAFAVGHELAQQFVKGEKCLGEILQGLRKEHKAAGLAFSAFCPPQVCVVAAGAGVDIPPETEIAATPLPRLPYRPFAAYEAADRALFYGRDEDIVHGALLADQSGMRGIFLHGSPAVGKTSYLQAGLLPYLEQESIGYRVLRDRSPLETPVAEADYPILILRCTSDLAGQFADALSVFCAQPLTYTTPAGTQVTVDLPVLLQQAVTGKPVSTAIQAAPAAIAVTATPGEATDDEASEPAGLSPRELWIALRDDKDMLPRILDAITRSLPFELVIAVDQVEELITLVGTPQEQVRRRKALEMLAALAQVGARCKLIFVLRTQALGQLFSLLPDGQTLADWRTFYLRALSKTEMTDALLWPTSRESIPYCEEIPQQKYGFSFEEGLAQQIVADARKAAAAEQQSPLPLLQAIGALLYDRYVLDKKQDVVRAGDVKDLGGVEAATTKHLDLTLSRLSVSSQGRSALRALISKLYTSHSDGTLSRDLVAAAELRQHWDKAPEPVEEVVNQAAEEQGLFTIQQLLIGGHPDTYVSLAQDSLANLGKKIADERRFAQAARTKVVDVLWIMIPLMFLVAAVTLWITNYRATLRIQELKSELKNEFAEKASKDEEDLKRDIVDLVKRMREKQRLPQYLGLLAQADLALRADNALRARQLLLSQPAMRAVAETAEKAKVPDLRGFEWKYLWRHLNSERWLFEGHAGIVNCVAVSADGRWAASASDDASVRVWSLTSGELTATITGPKGAVKAVAFSPDGKSLASAGADKIVRLWDISALKKEHVTITKETKALAGHNDAVNALAFGKDSNLLASGSADKTVILWDLAAGKEKHVLKEKGHTAAVTALAFANDGKMLASAGGDTFILWDAEAGKQRQSVKTAHQSIAALAFAPDGKTLASGGVETKLDAELGVIRFWNSVDGKETLGPIRHGAGVQALAFGPDGTTIASGGRDRIVRLFDVKSAKQRHSWIGHLGAIHGLAFAKDVLVSGSADATVKAWSPAQSSGPEVIQVHDKDWVMALALNPKNTLLASGSSDGTVRLWNPATGAPIKDLPKHQGAVTALAFSHHKAKDKDKEKLFLAVGTRDDKNQGELKVWLIESDPNEGWKFKEQQTLKGHDKGVTCLAFDPAEGQADVLVSGSADTMVKVWNIDTGKEKETYRGHKDEVRCVAFYKDGKTFASGGKDKAVCLYELDSKEVWAMPDLHLNAVESIAFVPVAVGPEDHMEVIPLVLAGSADNTMALWNYKKLAPGKVENIKPGTYFRTHAQAVTGVIHQELDNNSLIVSSSADGTIKLYDLFNERLTLMGHHGPVRAIALASDQSFLVSAGNDGTIRFWRASQERAAAKKN